MDFADAAAGIQETEQVETLFDDFRMQTASKEDIENVVTFNPFDQPVLVEPFDIFCSRLCRFLDLQHFHDQQSPSNQFFLKHWQLQTPQ